MNHSSFIMNVCGRKSRFKRVTTSASILQFVSLGNGGGLLA